MTKAPTSPSQSEGDACKRSAARRGCTKFNATTQTATTNPPSHDPSNRTPRSNPVHPPAHRCAQRVPLRKAKRGKPNLPFAPRRGRVQAKRSTQGMHEIQRNHPNRNNQQPSHDPLNRTPRSNLGHPPAHRYAQRVPLRKAKGDHPMLKILHIQVHPDLLSTYRNAACVNRPERVSPSRFAASSTIASTRAGRLTFTRTLLPDSFDMSASTSAQNPPA